MEESKPRTLFPELITRSGPEVVVSRKKEDSLGGVRLMFNAIQHARFKLGRHELPIDHESLGDRRVSRMERLGYCPSET